MTTAWIEVRRQLRTHQKLKFAWVFHFPPEKREIIAQKQRTYRVVELLTVVMVVVLVLCNFKNILSSFSFMLSRFKLPAAPTIDNLIVGNSRHERRGRVVEQAVHAISFLLESLRTLCLVVEEGRVLVVVVVL